MDDTWLVVGSLLLTLLIFLTYRSLSHGKSLPRPPGPKGWPIIGNALQIPHNRLWEKALEWGEIYGDLVFLENFGKPLLFINKYDVAVELLANGSKYASRPPFVMMELEGWDRITSVVPYGDRLKKQRAFQHRFLSSLETIDYREIQFQETQVMLQGLLTNPKDYAKYLRRLPGSVTMRNFYGHKVEGDDDPYIQLGEIAVNSIAEAEHYLFLDSLPWLRYLPDWLPWVGFPRLAKEAQSITRAVIDDMPKRTMAENAATPSMMSILVNENTRDDGTVANEEEIAASTAMLYIGGVDTSVTALMTFVLAMLKYPEVQERARSELCQIVGEQRLPSFEDMEKLPYIRAVCTEVLRWQSILPLIVPHYTTEDDEYNGYLIPAGTIVMANVWAMNRNPLDFPDPSNFCPERWLESVEDKQSIRHPPRPEDFIFGFGRRACPGRKWAEHLLFIAIASMVAAFKFDAKHKDGMPIPFNEKYVEDFIWHLDPSECNITPRSETMADLIRNAERL